MKKALTIILLLFSVVLFGQQGFKTVYSDYPEKGEYLDMLIDNDTLIFYGLTSDSLQRQGIRFYKADTLGNILFTKIIVDTTVVITTAWYKQKIIKTLDNNYAMIGGTVDGDVYFLKVNHDFELLSYVTYLSDVFTFNSSLMEVNHGFFVLAKKTQPNNTLAYDVELIRTNTEGQEIWRKQYGKYEYTETAEGILKISENEFLLYGSYYPYPDWDDPSWPQSTWSSDYFLAIDSSGNELWSRYGDSTEITAFVVDGILMPDSSIIYISGTWEPDNGAYNSQAMIARRDKDMNLIWQRKIGYLGGNQLLMDLEMTPDSNFIASGFAKLVDYPAYPKGIHFKFSAEGDSIWIRGDSITMSDKLKIISTEIHPNGSIFSVGDYRAPYGKYGGVIMKITPDGCVDTLNCFPLDVSGVDREELEELLIYPNPAHNFIQFNLPLGFSKGSIEIIDLLGRVFVRQNIVEEQQKVDIKGLPVGIYMYRIFGKNGEIINTGKILKE